MVTASYDMVSRTPINRVAHRPRQEQQLQFSLALLVEDATVSTQENQRRYYKRHKKKILARRKEYEREYCARPEVKKHRQHYDRVRRLGITQEQVDAKLAKQGNVCGLCGLPFIEGEAPRADHSHVTGEFRGMLHRHCNLGLGTFNDDPILLAKAARYLLQFIPAEGTHV